MPDLKELEQQKAKAQQEQSGIDKEINLLQEQRRLVTIRIQEINEQIIKLTTEITVSDHAVVRYFGRCLGHDIEEIKNKILPENIKESLKTIGDCMYPVNGFNIVVRDNKVVTVIRNE